MKKRSVAVTRIAGILGWGILAGAGVAAAQTSESASESKNFKLSQQQVSPALSLPPVAARVNGTDIPIVVFWKDLWRSAGANVLSSQIDDLLVEQEVQKAFGGGAPKGKKAKKEPTALRKIEEEMERRFLEFKKQFSDEASLQERLRGAGLEAEDIRRQIRLGLYREKLLESKTRVAPGEVRKYFDQNKERLATPELVHLRHILVSGEQEARDLVLAIKVGASFDLLAKEKSLDAATKDRGGDLGFFARGMLVPALQEKAFTLPAGGSDVVQTALGYHVIQVAEKRPAKEAVFDAETQKTIERILTQAKFNQEYPAYIQALRKNAQIQVFINQ